MRSIIGEFYLGNITPDVTVIKQTSELKKAVQEMADAASFLREHLDGECLATLEQLASAQSTSNTITGQERCMDGFRTGARFILDILTGESENLAPLVQTKL